MAKNPMALEIAAMLRERKQRPADFMVWDGRNGVCVADAKRSYAVPMSRVVAQSFITSGHVADARPDGILWCVPA